MLERVRRFLDDVKRHLEKYLSFWCVRVNLYTDHSIYHCVRVENYADRLVSLLGNLRLRINLEELLLLKLGVYFHDVGMICGRERHAENSRRILKNYFAFLRNELSEEEIDVLGDIVAAHVFQASLNDVDVGRNIISYFLKNRREYVRPRLLSAILRLADELDIDERRIDHLALQILL